jgi:hypothetical protein
MTRFQRLTWDDLDNFNRAELLPRVEAEQQYWALICTKQRAVCLG